MSSKGPTNAGVGTSHFSQAVDIGDDGGEGPASPSSTKIKEGERIPPLMRASHIMQNLESLSCLGPEIERRVLAEIDPQTIADVEREIKTSWLPLKLDVEITAAVGRVLGAEGVRNWSSDALSKSVEGPLLRPILDGGLRVFGIRPDRIFGIARRGFGAVYKNCGGLDVKVTSATSLALTHDNAPVEMLNCPLYLEGMAGAFSAILKIMRVEGMVTVASVEVSSQRIVYDVCWKMTG